MEHDRRDEISNRPAKYSFFAGLVIAVLGLALAQAETLPDSWEPWPGVLGVVFAVSGLVVTAWGGMSLLRENVLGELRPAVDALERLDGSIQDRFDTSEAMLKAFTTPSRLEKLLRVDEEVGESIQQLGDHHWWLHEHGELPMAQGQQAYITVAQLGQESFPRYAIDVSPHGIEWSWLKFTIHHKATYHTKPGSQRDAASFIDPMVVMNYPAYVAIRPWRIPRFGAYFPVDWSLATSMPQHQEVLRKVHWISDAGSSTKDGGVTAGLSARISWTFQDELVDAGSIQLEPVLPLSEAGRAKVLRQVINKSDETEAFKEAKKGVYEVYQATEGSIEEWRTKQQAAIKRSVEDSPRPDWTLTYNYDLIVPAKAHDASGNVIRDLQEFWFTIDKIGRFDYIQFTTADAKNLRIANRFPQLSTQLVDVASVPNAIVRGGNTWSIRSGDQTWFPGDFVVFSWEDNLLDERTRGTTDRPNAGNDHER